MSAAFGQIIPSLLTGTVENSASLLNAKFDFSLFKVEAPAEFKAVGPALASLRREEAELGGLHRTARRLAGLFEQAIPSTPKLVSAYGKRVSAIVSDPNINPTASAKDGPFQAFVGVDGTAMWAAATSGTSAIAVYLLACLLARNWDSTIAVSIWVELIDFRKQEIQNGYQSHKNVSESTLLASFQDITREDLGLWDASARAWLRSADQVKRWHLTQLRLVSQNSGIEFAGSGTMYAKVMLTWFRALTGTEALLKDQPQQITDASVLLAFSAWHLFPDLIVLAGKTTKIPFNDKLFSKQAIGTIGVTPADDPADQGIQWSLTLSHMQYYGDPVEVQSYVAEPRVQFSKIRLAALGCLFSKWRLRQNAYVTGARFICGLWQLLGENRNLPDGCTVESQFKWLYVFKQASQDLIDAYDSRSQSVVQDCLSIISFGSRRGEDFIGPAEHVYEPFFGLCQTHVLDALKEKSDSNCAIEYFRGVAKTSHVPSHKGLIVVGRWEDLDDVGERPDRYEFALVGPHAVPLRKRTIEDAHVTVDVSARWYRVGPSKIEEMKTYLEEHRVEWSTRDELLFLEVDDTYSAHRMTVPWPKAPKLFSQNWHQYCEFPDTGSHIQLSRGSIVICDCFEAAENQTFYLKLGSYKCGLYVLEDFQTASLATEFRQVAPEKALEILQLTSYAHTLWSYIAALTQNSWENNDHGRAVDSTVDIGIREVVRPSCFSIETCKALHALAVANMIFERISSPTISLRCMESSLHEANWAPVIAARGELTPRCPSPCMKREMHECIGISSRLQTAIPEPPSRQQAFACIAFFDSGTVEISPDDLEQVFAMSCGNSIYVAGVVLSDPTERLEDYDVRHITGNLGKRGISLLVAPQQPRIRKPSLDYSLVNHVPYDFKTEDNFQDTSLHLSFTNWTHPLTDRTKTRVIDQDVHYLESVISVRDRGVWVADLDILKINLQETTQLEQISCASSHQHCPSDIEYTSVDSWEELLDPPSSTTIVRAHENWAARLAVTSILFQRGIGRCIGFASSPAGCFVCLEGKRRAELQDSGVILASHESSLPQFCID